MRLTLDLVRRAPQVTNTLRQREIDLRGLGLTILEERPLLLLDDSFDVLNLSQNPLSRLEYFPGSIGKDGKGTMQRLQTLIVHRNRISHVSVSTCAAVLPNIRAFLADHNEFAALHDLLFLKEWPKLEILSFEHNPVTQHVHDARLRAFVVFLCPLLKLVNYQRVTETDRRNAASMGAEFAEAVRAWQRPPGGVPAPPGDGSGGGPAATGAGDGERRKMRKRGREARGMAAAAGGAGGAGGLGGLGGAAGGPEGAEGLSVAAGPGGEAEEAAAHARLEALEVRMAAAETEEELMEIQQEIMELEAAAKQQAKTKRTRTQH